MGYMITLLKNTEEVIMINWLSQKLTNNYSKVPLFFVTFDLNKYLENGVNKSCNVKIHPCLAKDDHIKLLLNDVIDYIRENYDMEKLSK